MAKKNPTPVSFAPRLKGNRRYPWSIGAWDQTTRIMRLPGGERSLTISSTVWIQYTNVSVRRTCRHRSTGKDRAYA